nr:hypothetical protein [uncultured Holophaga sp.]
MASLDVKSLAYACVASHTAMACVMTYVYLQRKTYPGFGAWVLSSWCSALAITLFLLQGNTPDWLGTLPPNILVLLTLTTLQCGVLKFAGRPTHRARNAVILLVYAGIILWCTYPAPSMRGRLLASSLPSAFLALETALIAHHELARRHRIINPIISPILVTIAIIYLARAIGFFLLPPGPGRYLAPSSFQGALVLAYLFGHTGLPAGLLILNANRLEIELSRSIQECRVLRGVIPICAYCKKIRDDQGAWDQVEAYLHTHSEATFSHGICPDCLEKERRALCQAPQESGKAPER